MLEKFFRLKEHNTSIRQEVTAGITTFLTMAYIIFVHPDMLAQTGMDKGALIRVTFLAAFVGTMITALWVNAPIAMAPGMGLNAFFTYTLVFGQGASWEEALGVVFLSGIVFLLLTCQANFIGGKVKEELRNLERLLLIMGMYHGNRKKNSGDRVNKKGKWKFIRRKDMTDEIILTVDNFDEEVLKSDIPALVDF